MKGQTRIRTLAFQINNKPVLRQFQQVGNYLANFDEATVITPIRVIANVSAAVVDDTVMSAINWGN